MIRLNCVVEGKTELRFVQNVLRPHLAQFSVFVFPQIVLFGRDGDAIYRGGLKSYQKPQKHLQDWMQQDRNSDAYFTTMFDLYRLPSDFPGYTQMQQTRDPYQKVRLLEDSFAHDLQEKRFIPYIQLHEFESLLFANVRQFDWEFLEHEAAIRKLAKIADEFGNPELINDNVATAPSKRIMNLIPEYSLSGRKSSAGPIIAEKIGLATIRQKCRHFDEWLTKLEQLGKAVTS